MAAPAGSEAGDSPPPLKAFIAASRLAFVEAELAVMGGSGLDMAGATELLGKLMSSLAKLQQAQG